MRTLCGFILGCLAGGVVVYLIHPYLGEPKDLILVIVQIILLASYLITILIMDRPKRKGT